jgi:type I restriction enzyme S subunit
MSREIKDSGIEWIGEIPADWCTIKLKHVAKIITGNTPSKNDDSYYCENGLLWVKPENLIGFNGISDTKEKLNKKGNLLARAVPQNTLLICCIGSIGKFGYTTEEAAFNQQINAIEFNKEKIYWKYGIYYMSTQEEQQKYYQNGNVVYILNTQNQKRVMLSYPSLQEQQKIADYLDEKISITDNIIAQTNLSIIEYKKYKQVLITETVTKGLNPEVEMKDSGIDWIGKIPRNWNLPKIKQLFFIGRGRVIAKTELDDNRLYPVYSSQTKNDGRLGNIDTYDFDKTQLTWTTDGANAGTVFLREGKYNCTNVCGTLLPKDDKNNMGFMKYALEYIAIFHKRADINGFKIMNNEMAEIIITLPSNKEEQQEIVDYLDQKCSEIDNLITQKQQLLIEIESYKKSLIYECVTGKREVI